MHIPFALRVIWINLDIPSLNSLGEAAIHDLQKFLFGLILAAAALVSSSPLAEERHVTLSYFESPFQNLQVDILSEAYKRIGISATFTPFPGARALKMSSTGQLDGETNRIGKIKGKYPTLIQVPVPMHPLIGAAFSMDRSIKIESWEDLKPYDIGVMRGVPFYEKPTEGMDRTYANDYKQLFNMLVHDRVDIVVGTTFSSRKTIAENYPHQEIMKHKANLIYIDTFHYLHEKNKDLVPLIQASLQEMRDSGRIDEIVQENLKVN